MSAVKVALKFLDYIENPDKVRTYCKDIATSLTTLMKSHPEIQYVVLRSLHAIVQKRPYLLDKDYKSFFVQHNDPVYVKLEKIEILYKLADAKNFESILSEFKSYAIMEFDADIVKKVIKYIGCICFRFEKSLELCVELMKEILEHNQENTLSGGTLVMRDILRKYRGVSLELLKRIDQDYINALQDDDHEAKAAVIFIIGEFCSEINNCVELIRPFVENFNNEANQVKLQTLNSVIKIYVKLPNSEGIEELTQECLKKGGEETENPDVRDRVSKI
jgi:AP-2 complex subunit beta-1/AP-1 complex subunit beta-1